MMVNLRCKCQCGICGSRGKRSDGFMRQHWPLAVTFFSPLFFCSSQTLICSEIHFWTIVFESHTFHRARFSVIRPQSDSLNSPRGWCDFNRGGAQKWHNTVNWSVVFFYSLTYCAIRTFPPFAEHPPCRNVPKSYCVTCTIVISFNLVCKRNEPKQIQNRYTKRYHLGKLTRISPEDHLGRVFLL